jgi:anion-transporting  ArsA/GET3 family ATPase
VQTLMRVLLKYRAVVRPAGLASELIALSKSIKQLQALLRNGREARFIVVTRPARLPRLETERLLRRLRALKIAVPALVCNAMTLAPRQCPRCRAVATVERGELAQLKRAQQRRQGGRRDCAIILTPLAVPPPRGVAALDSWANLWRIS